MLPPGALDQHLDAVQLLLAGFFLFFLLLVVYLRREDKREGYPLVARTRRRAPIIGWPAPPPSKTYALMNGETATVPHFYPQTPIEGIGVSPNGMPLVPKGDPLIAGLGAGAYAMRSEAPMRTLDGRHLLMPLREAHDWRVRKGDYDPRGWPVLGSDFRAAGRVTDLWVDRGARILRYLEVALDGEDNDNKAARTILLPIFHCDISYAEREIRVMSLKPEQLMDVPRLAAPDVITPREEDRINGFYAGGTIYSDPY